MSRVSPADVKAIITTSLSYPMTQSLIDAANAIITKSSACIGGDEALLTQIELYLSAHFVGMIPQSGKGAITKEGIPGFETSYSSPQMITNELDKTSYGTIANRLSNGCLSQTNQTVAQIDFL